MTLRPTALLAVLLAAAPVALAVAQETPQVQRQDLMEAVGKATGALGAMVKGERPYDAAVANEQLDLIANNARTFLTLFPEGSETGHETRALPAIWQNFDKFTADGEALAAAATEAKAQTASLDTFRPAFGKVGQTCRACHEEFRAPER